MTVRVITAKAAGTALATAQPASAGGIGDFLSPDFGVAAVTITAPAPSPRCRRHGPSCATSPAPTEPFGPRDRSPRSTRSTRLRQGLRLSVALGVARPAGPSPCPRRSPRRFAVVGSLTSPLRLLCPCPLAGVKEEGTGGMGGAAAAGDRGALSRLRVGRGRRAAPSVSAVTSALRVVRSGSVVRSEGRRPRSGGEFPSHSGRAG